MGLVLIIVFFSSLWVYFDAKAIGVKKGMLKGFFNLGAAGWFWVCLGLWIIGFPAYLAKRGELKRLAAQAESAQTESQAQAPQPSNIASRVDYLSQLEKLGELKKNGVLTDEEFTEKKKQLLASS